MQPAYVHPAGAGQCYTSIQAAVDAASDGDEIIIRAGKYSEQVTVIGKNLSLVGRDGAVVQAFPDM
jgi:pectin methylesterase-like acyl-CoA thioesterase